MRIAIISTMSGALWGGSEELWRTMAERALYRGDQIVLSRYRWSIVPPKVAALQKQGVQVLYRPQPGPNWWRQGVHNRAGSLVSPFRAVFALKPDVICVSQGATYDVMILQDLYRLLVTSRIPYVIVSQSNSDYYALTTQNRRLATELFLDASTLVFLSARTLEQTERQLARDLANAIVLNNPVNLVDCSIVPFPQSRQINMASVASLNVEWKSQDVLFQVLGSPFWKERDWKLNVFGTGPDKDYLTELVRYYHIQDRVAFRGHVPDVRAIWKENHLFVFPSRAESGPLALIEAMLCGRPTVATDIGGIMEWLQEPKTGFIAEAATARSFGAAMERAWAARSDWEKIGLQAHASANAKRSPDPGQVLLDLLTNVVHTRQAV